MNSTRAVVGAAVVMSALGGVLAGIMLIHGPGAQPPTPRQTPAAVVQQLDPSTPSTTTETAPMTTSEQKLPDNVTIITDDPAHPITVITGPPPVANSSEQVPLQMPTAPGLTTTAEVPPPVLTPQMPPGYPGSPTTPGDATGN